MKLKYLIFGLIMFSVFSFGIYGKYIVSGKVFISNKSKTAGNIEVLLYSLPETKGKLIMKIKTDKNGNFKSDEFVDFTNGLYPAIKSENQTKYMKIPAKTGNCMICHTNNKLTIE